MTTMSPSLALHNIPHEKSRPSTHKDKYFFLVQCNGYNETHHNGKEITPDEHRRSQNKR